MQVAKVQIRAQTEVEEVRIGGKSPCGWGGEWCQTMLNLIFANMWCFTGSLFPRQFLLSSVSRSSVAEALPLAMQTTTMKPLVC